MNSRKKKAPSSVTITLPNPCGQDWTKMSIAGEGRYCNQCSRVVMDFTNMSDAEMVKVLTEASHPVCGSFRPSQLDRPITLVQRQTSSRWPRVLVGALLLMAATGPHFILAQAPASSISLQKQAATNGQGEIPASKRAMQSSGIHVIVKALDPRIRGVQLPYAKVSILELGMEKQAEFSGIADFELPSGKLPDHLTILVTHEDYLATSKEIATPTATLSLEIELSDVLRALGGPILRPSDTERMPLRTEADIQGTSTKSQEKVHKK